jgi:hypothetical protein
MLAKSDIVGDMFGSVGRAEVSPLRALFDPSYCLILLGEPPPDSVRSRITSTWVPKATGDRGMAPLHLFFVDPCAKEVNVFAEDKQFVLNHELMHYLQRLRSASGSLLTGCVSLLQRWSLRIRAAYSSRGGRCDRSLLLRAIPPEELTFYSRVMSWHSGRPNFLTAGDIKEAEAELLALVFGKNMFRFKRYTIGNPVTLHFRELSKSKPATARAYLEAEAVLDLLTPSFFPLLAHFALSMPYRGTLDTPFDLDPVHPEEAFNAALDYVSRNRQWVMDYYAAAYELYQKQSVDLSLGRQLVCEFCNRVCHDNGWISMDTDSRRRICGFVDGPEDPVLTGLKRIEELAIETEARCGPLPFMEPFCKTSEVALAQLPKPPMLAGDRVYCDDRLGPEYVSSAVSWRSFNGAVRRLLFDTSEENACPWVSMCKFAPAGLCHEHLVYPIDAKQCRFPAGFSTAFGVKLEEFL